ncbi:MAG: hypothetical protein N3D11_10425 [Candidatus Sumerlaeia bacterium]|nr:hypothetical protein [Candidatus Sumerlaeia bacterium]
MLRLHDGRVERFFAEAVLAESQTQLAVVEAKTKRRHEFPRTEIWQIDFAAQPLPRGSIEQVWLKDGSRLSGRLLNWAVFPSRPAIQTDLFRTLQVWDDSIIGLTRGSPPPRLPPAPADKDLLCTADGDQLLGQFLHMDAAAVGFRSDLGTLNVLREKTTALVLAPRKGESTLDKPWALYFTNGDRVRTDSWAIQSGRLQCALSGATPASPAVFLQRAVLFGATAEPFSAVQPQRFSMRPRLDGVRAIVVDRRPDGGALRIGDREYSFGLHLQPDCEMEYVFGEDYAFFLTEWGLSSALTVPQSTTHNPQFPRARLLLAVGDGPWQTFEVRQSDWVQYLVQSLMGSRRLRLRLEAADAWGAGVHVVLGEPLLIRAAKK